LVGFEPVGVEADGVPDEEQMPPVPIAERAE
jgi:hypothetical protein